MSRPASYTFQIYQGQTWRAAIRLKDAAGDPVPLTGFSARMFVRTEIGASDTVIELSTANGRLAIDELAGIVNIDVDSDTTAALPLNFDTQIWVYDLELFDAATPPVVVRIMQGSVIAFPEVTR